MKPADLKSKMLRLEIALAKEGILSTNYNRVYVDGDRVIYNVTDNDGWLAGAEIIEGDLVLKRGNKKT